MDVINKTKNKTESIIRYSSAILRYFKFRLFMVFHKDKYILKNTKYDIFNVLLAISEKKYKKIRLELEEKSRSFIKNMECINIAFVVYTASMWFFDELYNCLDNNARFNVAIIIGHKTMSSKEASNTEYNNTKQFFIYEKKMKVVPSTNISQYDILFYLTPYGFYEKWLDIRYIHLSQLIFHVSYGYMLAGNNNKLSLDMYHWSYRYYTDSLYYLEEIKKLNKYCGNARYFGFPKMDQYYSAMYKRISNKPTIIYAPHHSVNYDNYKTATFDENYSFFLNLIKKYKEKIFWVYKPHPLLRDHSVSAKIFNSFKDYDNYIEELKATGTVFVADTGEYYELFKASDAMITDSVSFLAEYQFTEKPLLLLLSEKACYNEFGNKIINTLYKCKGNDFDKIESFVSKILLGEDSMYNSRKEIFESDLDYNWTENNSSNKRIYNDIIGICTEK